MSKITPSELVFLKQIWTQGALSARELHAACGSELGWTFSSTRTTLRRMQEKGLLGTEKRHGVNVFFSAQGKVKIMAGLMQDFMLRVLEIKGDIPTSAFHKSSVLNDEDIKELKALLDENISGSPSDVEPPADKDASS